MEIRTGGKVMSHHAIVKRIKMEYAPVWDEQLKQYQYSNINIIQYEESSEEFLSMNYYNVISDKVIKEELITYWEGDVNHDILSIGDLLVIDGNSFEIYKVEKHTNGDVTYQIETQLAKYEHYDNELMRAKGHYNDYSKQLQEKKRNENVQSKSKETLLGSIFKQLFINNK